MIRLPAGSSSGIALPCHRPPTFPFRSRSCNQLPVVRYTLRGSGGARAQSSPESHRRQPWQQAVVGSVLAAYLWACPCTDALAGPVSLRQAEEVLDKISGGNSGRALNKFVDKLFTVVTGQTAAVTSEVLGKDLKQVISNDEKIREEWKSEFVTRVRNFATSVMDFNPFSFTESAGTAVQGLAEAAGGAAESFATYELSALVALGERWFVLTPIVAIPMVIQMNRQRRARLLARDAAAAVSEEEALIKGELVRQELRRLALKSELLDLVESMGELTLQPSRNSASPQRTQLRSIVEELEELSTVVDDPDVVGNWRLIYVSEQREAQAQPEFGRIAGLELRNIRQTVTPGDAASLAGLCAVRNSAELSLGPLGVVSIAIQGSWESLQNGQSALVSFDHFSVVPKQILGNQVGSGIPAVTLSLPRSLQQSAEWEVVYVDDLIRINRSRSGQLFIFQVADLA